MKKYNLSNYDFIHDGSFQLFLSTKLIERYGKKHGIPKKKWFETLEKCAREYLAELNKPRTTSNI